MTKDEGRCGISPIETGKWDPYWKSGACPNHDKAMTEQREGKRNDPLRYTGKFLVDTTKTAINGLYAVLTFPIYITVGGLGGLFLGLFRGSKKG